MKISEIKKLMSIDFESQIIKTGELSKIENINYKLGAKFIYNHPILSKDRVYLDWSLAIKILVLNELRDGVTYSLAVLGQINMGDHLIKTVTFGNHLLINKDINIDSLITYIEGQIEIAYLGLVSGELLRESEDVITYFMCREISIIENIYKRVSNINYLNNEINTLIPRKDFSSFTSNRTTMLLKILPLSPLINEKLGKYGSLIGEPTINNKTGKQYRLNHEITVFIYDVSPNRYKGIVYKKDLEYFQFSDILIDNFTNKESAGLE